MMVTFVSQCEKNALKKTRRVLDAFANRIGDNTWQTIITQEGLDAVKKLLRKTASKSTAVSCHWIRTRARSEFIWVVGNRDKFSSEGYVAVNSTKKNLLKDYSESDWKYLPLIKSLVAVSALFHDWGKSNDFFQDKLTNKKITSDPIRHEWLSCLLLYSFIKVCEKKSKHWLDCLIDIDIDEKDIIKNVDLDVKNPFRDLSELEQVIFWLILSHHKLPAEFKTKKLLNDLQGVEAKSINDVVKYITKSWGYENKNNDNNRDLVKCFTFSKGLLSNSNRWTKEIKKWSYKLKNESKEFETVLNDGSIRVILHYARLSLMLGDYDYSSKEADLSWENATGLFANTDFKTKKLKQSLDEHIVGVAKSALKIAHSLVKLEHEMPMVHDVKGLKKLSPKNFSWQDKAVQKLKKHYKAKSGFFAVNMASTGCGKTFANAKIMQATSSDKKSLRYVLALGLRTLTLQTGDEYRNNIGLNNSELAVLIGSKAISILHNTKDVDIEENIFSHTGSESSESLFDEDIDFEGDFSEKGLDTVLKNKKDRQFLYAPVLACTIDHLMGSVETKRGGKYILPSLRLSSSDLVIDEIDDFSGSDSIAIGRLIYLAGLLGRKVMISSATIPPDLAEGYFNVYKKGWNLFSKTREVNNNIYTSIIDEFTTTVENFDSNCDIELYKNFHKVFVEKRVNSLAKQDVKRKADIFECKTNMDDCEFEEDDIKTNSYFEHIKEAVLQKHSDHYSVDNKSTKKVSFGVVRVANIEPCISLSIYLQNVELDEDTEFRVMSYHSRQILLLRHIQEEHLDAVLKRKEKDGEEINAFKNNIIRSHLDNTKAKNIIFILVATPVEEVGRDHDFDWAVIEPSSYRSLIQLAGRVRRHREGNIEKPNISVMQYNYKAFKACDEDGKYFIKPGYEEMLQLNTHDLKELLDEEKLLNSLDATLRIQKPQSLDEYNSLSDLEHYVIQEDLTTYSQVGADSMQGFINEAWYLSAHPQIFHKFRDSPESTQIFFLYDDKSDEIYIGEKDDCGEFINREGIYEIEIYCDENITSLWLPRDYKSALKVYSNLHSKSIVDVSKLFGELNFMYQDGAEYRYSDQTGLVKI